MANNDWMNTEPLLEVTTGFCNIKTPDTGNPNARNPQFRNKKPVWKAEIKVDRSQDQWQEFLAKVREHVKNTEGKVYAEKAEPWVLTKDAKIVTKEDGSEVTYEPYEYIRVQTKKDPHDARIILGPDNKPFTEEVFNNSEVSVAVNTMYNPVSNHIVTFYLAGLKVHRNGTGGGGGGKAAALQLIGVPFGGDVESTEDAPAEGAPFDPSQL